MNLQKLHKCEQDFLMLYPSGFADESLQRIIKKHQLAKRSEQVHQFFEKTKFNNPTEICDSMVKINSQSSLVSLFEKPKFRDAINSMSKQEQIELADGLENLLYGDQESGFNQICNILKIYKLAKWSIVTLVINYFNPEYEVFIKPTTTKNILNYFEISDLKYSPTPSWEFYCRYRQLINEMKTHVSPTIATSNVAFCGFIMMMTDQGKTND